MPSKRIDLPEKPQNLPAITKWTWDRVNYRSQVQRGQMKGKTYIEVQALAVLPDNFDSRRDCGGFDELQAAMSATAADAISILNKSVIGRLPLNGENEAERLLRQIVQDLPAKRDWLDPQVEAAAKKLLNIK
jgi:hypothetical protein